MIHLTPSDTGKLARLSNGIIVGPLKSETFDGALVWYIHDSDSFIWNNDGLSLSPASHAGIIEVLDMPAKKLTITKDDVGRWVKLRNGWIVGPISCDRGIPAVVNIGSFNEDGSFLPERVSPLDIIAVIDPPDQEDHA